MVAIGDEIIFRAAPPTRGNSEDNLDDGFDCVSSRLHWAAPVLISIGRRCGARHSMRRSLSGRFDRNLMRSYSRPVARQHDASVQFDLSPYFGQYFEHEGGRSKFGKGAFAKKSESDFPAV